MATQSTNVDIAGMKAAQPHFETALSETSRVYSSMQDQAQTLEASWTGDSAQTFVGALNQWLENCNVVKQQLQVVTQKLEANTGNYQRVHTDASDQSSALRQAVSAGLPGF
ncbi:WXG100 family type VII secretion target [Streptomyces sp. PTM05]|uniref:WXG100 family type VII secretion target n=1 Tax=Streptantibioticus parmotrematis TaxID=2873249 RepID=A0ABS7QS86_9ACTN|nr:WXG100 family type VII secretion target [Streptantibioticus parmotrematis]MBY8886055.1 WXG100 family type VII secretion target [Streptantibioticus parmotrematis]